jgi:hypothetical protein
VGTEASVSDSRVRITKGRYPAEAAQSELAPGPVAAAARLRDVYLGALGDTELRVLMVELKDRTRPA